MRWVLDTDVVVAAMRSPAGASAALLLATLERRLTLLANVAMVLEYEAVCGLEQHRLAAGLSMADVQRFVDGVASLVEPVSSHFIWRPQLRDPGDEMVLEAAVNGMADAIVSFNHRDFANVPQRFGIRLLWPREALKELER